MARQTTQLNESLRLKVSSSFRPDLVGQKEYDKGLEQLKNCQSQILSMLVAQEEIVKIIPGFNPYTFGAFKGIVVITKFRVIWTQGGRSQFVLIDDIGDMNAMVMPDSHHVIQLHSKESMQYKAFRNSKGLAHDKYWLGAITIEFSRRALVNDFLSEFGMRI